MIDKVLKLESKGRNVSITLIGIILTILVASIPAVVAYGSLTEKVNTLQKQYDNVGTRQIEDIDNLESRLRLVENSITGTGVSLRTIQSDINEIKSDIKAIRDGVNIS